MMDHPEDGLVDVNLALQPLLEAAVESSSSATTIRALVIKAISDPNVFCGFDQLKSIFQETLTSEKAGADGASILRTLDLFSYGKYSDYTSNPAQYIRLTESQIAKLRQLTLLSLVQDTCMQGKDSISYQQVAGELGLNGQDGPSMLQQAESFAISCIYAGVLEAKLDQQKQKMFILAQHGPPCRARDVPFSHIHSLTETLVALQKRIDQAQQDLDSDSSLIHAALKKNTEYWQSGDERRRKEETQSGTVRSFLEGGSPHRSGSATSRQPKRSRGGQP